MESIINLCGEWYFIILTGVLFTFLGMVSIKLGDFFYAVYPDYNTGHEALVVMLRGGVYSKLTLKEASTASKYQLHVTASVLLEHYE